MALVYDYTKSKLYVEQLGLVWFGDDYITQFDVEAEELAFTQEQVDAAMRGAIKHVKFIFTPTNFSYWTRIKIAFFFLTGIGSKKK